MEPTGLFLTCDWWSPESFPCLLYDWLWHRTIFSGIWLAIGSGQLQTLPPGEWDPYPLWQGVRKILLSGQYRSERCRLSWLRRGKMQDLKRNWLHKGAFINDVTQVWGRGDQYICDTRYKIVSRIAILVWQRGEGGQKKSKFAWRHLWMALSFFFFFLYGRWLPTHMDGFFNFSFLVLF